MDLRSLAPRYSQRIAFFGNIDIMVLATNDRARIEEEVRAKLAAGMASRRYIFHFDHSVPPSVSWSAYQYVVELLEQYGSIRNNFAASAKDKVAHCSGDCTAVSGCFRLRAMWPFSLRIVGWVAS